MTSDKKNVSLLTDLFLKQGLTDIVISPGSRNAPIINAFVGKKGVRALSIIDERSAAYFALGIAQQTRKAVAVACTSGTAALNYSPAIAEAYYRRIPLLILTADRPPELIDVGDGQTIRQKNVYANFIKASFELPVVAADPASFRQTQQIIREALNSLYLPEPGPVHINIPFREPLYRLSEEEITARPDFAGKIAAENIDSQLERIARKWNNVSKVMIIAGQGFPDGFLNKRLSTIADKGNAVVLTETTSNLRGEKFIDSIDNVVSTLSDQETKDFQPELLITFGGMVVSKMVKKYLRLNPPKEHWHISPSGEAMDTYFSLTGVVKTDGAGFFKQISRKLNPLDPRFANRWLGRLKKVNKIRDQYIRDIEWSDFRVFDLLLKQLPQPSVLHLGNSTPVRYSQLFGSRYDLVYQSNRGVSGIDGQLSTTAGSAWASDQFHTLITGDLGFFYDSNALMNHHLTPNLRFIVVNNAGGGIFRFIPGPDKSPYLEEFFATRHNWRAEGIAKTFNVDYFRADDEKSLIEIMKEFFKKNTDRPKLLEIITPSNLNAEILKNYFRLIAGK